MSVVVGGMVLLSAVSVSGQNVFAPPVVTPGGFDPWAAYRARWDSIQTATIYTTETVKMLRTAIDPMEAPLSIYVEGKIDRPNQRSKANIFLNFGGMQFGSQMKIDRWKKHTLQRPVMIVHDKWVPLERDVPTTTTENPAALLLDIALLPDPQGDWRVAGGPEHYDITVDGFTFPATFLTYANTTDGRMASVSVDGRAIRGYWTRDGNGRLRSVASVVSFTRAGRFGFIPREILYHQLDKDGDPYRDLSAVLVMHLNETPFSYLFE